MAVVRYTPLAEADFYLIAAYTSETWGLEQANKYLDEMEATCERLAKNPQLGRIHRGRRSGVRRLEQGSHVIFYEMSDDGILVGRILHKRMMPKLHEL